MLTTFPLGIILHNLEGLGRVVKWSVDLRKFNIEFMPCVAIKPQVLVDYVNECIEPTPAKEDQSDPISWTLSFDDSHTLQGSGARIMVNSPTGEELKYALLFGLPATNNMAEYEGLMAGLRVATAQGVRRLLVRGYFQLVVLQASKEYQATNKLMVAYLSRYKNVRKQIFFPSYLSF